MSFVRPEIPSRPDCLLSSVSSSTGDIPSLWCRYSRTDGSRSPVRVPITSPSSGVRPIEVSSDAPARMAQAEQPFPRCSVMRRVCSFVRPVSLR
jgi:hypothetical protein